MMKKSSDNNMISSNTNDSTATEYIEYCIEKALKHLNHNEPIKSSIGFEQILTTLRQIASDHDLRHKLEIEAASKTGNSITARVLVQKENSAGLIPSPSQERLFNNGDNLNNNYTTLSNRSSSARVSLINNIRKSQNQNQTHNNLNLNSTSNTYTSNSNSISNTHTTNSNSQNLSYTHHRSLDNVNQTTGEIQTTSSDKTLITNSMGNSNPNNPNYICNEPISTLIVPNNLSGASLGAASLSAAGKSLSKYSNHYGSCTALASLNEDLPLESDTYSKILEEVNKINSSNSNRNSNSNTRPTSRPASGNQTPNQQQIMINALNQNTNSNVNTNVNTTARSSQRATPRSDNSGRRSRASLSISPYTGQLSLVTQRSRSLSPSSAYDYDVIAKSPSDSLDRRPRSASPTIINDQQLHHLESSEIDHDEDQDEEEEDYEDESRRASSVISNVKFAIDQEDLNLIDENDLNESESESQSQTSLVYSRNLNSRGNTRSSGTKLKLALPFFSKSEIPCLASGYESEEVEEEEDNDILRPKDSITAFTGGFKQTNTKTSESETVDPLSPNTVNNLHNVTHSVSYWSTFAAVVRAYHKHLSGTCLPCYRHHKPSNPTPGLQPGSTHVVTNNEGNVNMSIAVVPKVPTSNTNTAKHSQNTSINDDDDNNVDNNYNDDNDDSDFNVCPTVTTVVLPPASLISQGPIQILTHPNLLTTGCDGLLYCSALLCPRQRCHFCSKHRKCTHNSYTRIAYSRDPKKASSAWKKTVIIDNDQSVFMNCENDPNSWTDALFKWSYSFGGDEYSGQVGARKSQVQNQYILGTTLTTGGSQHGGSQPHSQPQSQRGSTVSITNNGRNMNIMGKISNVSNGPGKNQIMTGTTVSRISGHPTTNSTTTSLNNSYTTNSYMNSSSMNNNSIHNYSNNNRYSNASTIMPMVPTPMASNKSSMHNHPHNPHHHGSHQNHVNSNLQQGSINAVRQIYNMNQNNLNSNCSKNTSNMPSQASSRRSSYGGGAGHGVAYNQNYSQRGYNNSNVNVQNNVNNYQSNQGQNQSNRRNYQNNVYRDGSTMSGNQSMNQNHNVNNPGNSNINNMSNNINVNQNSNTLLNQNQIQNQGQIINSQNQISNGNNQLSLQNLNNLVQISSQMQNLNRPNHNHQQLQNLQNINNNLLNQIQNNNTTQAQIIANLNKGINQNQNQVITNNNIIQNQGQTQQLQVNNNQISDTTLQQQLQQLQLMHLEQQCSEQQNSNIQAQNVTAVPTVQNANTLNNQYQNQSLSPQQNQLNISQMNHLTQQIQNLNLNNCQQQNQNQMQVSLHKVNSESSPIPSSQSTIGQSPANATVMMNNNINSSSSSSIISSNCTGTGTANLFNAVSNINSNNSTVLSNLGLSNLQNQANNQIQNTSNFMSMNNNPTVSNLNNLGLLNLNLNQNSLAQIQNQIQNQANNSGQIATANLSQNQMPMVQNQQAAGGNNNNIQGIRLPTNSNLQVVNNVNANHGSVAQGTTFNWM